MNDMRDASPLSPAPYPSNCHACAAPIARGEPAAERLDGALSCAGCVAAEPGRHGVTSASARTAA